MVIGDWVQYFGEAISLSLTGFVIAPCRQYHGVV